MMSQQPEQPTSYRYYVIGQSNPVRIALDNDGLTIRVESLNHGTGQLQRSPELLRRIEQSWEVREITRGRFEALCTALMQKKSNRPKGNGFLLNF